jgi:hypothetical protein
MLHQFLSANRDELVTRCRAKVAKRPSPQPTPGELEFGIPLFLAQLTETLRQEQISGPGDADNAEKPTEIGASAARHGNELLEKGFTADQVVHDYGDLCQAITELASERKAPVEIGEFRTLNRCLDDAIAGAVTEFGRQRDQKISNKGEQASVMGLDSAAHDLRSLLTSATIALDAIKLGHAGFAGATARVLNRTMAQMGEIIDRSLAKNV